MSNANITLRIVRQGSGELSKTATELRAVAAAADRSAQALQNLSQVGALPNLAGPIAAQASALRGVATAAGQAQQQIA